MPRLAARAAERRLVVPSAREGAPAEQRRIQPPITTRSAVMLPTQSDHSRMDRASRFCVSSKTRPSSARIQSSGNHRGGQAAEPPPHRGLRRRPPRPRRPRRRLRDRGSPRLGSGRHAAVVGGPRAVQLAEPQGCGAVPQPARLQGRRGGSPREGRCAPADRHQSVSSPQSEAADH